MKIKIPEKVAEQFVWQMVAFGIGVLRWKPDGTIEAVDVRDVYVKPEEEESNDDDH